MDKQEKAAAEAAIAKRVIDTYKYIDWSTPTSFVLFSNNYKNQKDELRNVCHAALSRQSSDKYDQLITNFYGYKPLELRFFDFLKNVLFKNYRDRIELIDSGIPITAETLDTRNAYCRQHDDSWRGRNWQYIKITKLDTIPANVVYDFCIASRVIVEYKAQLLAWDRMVEAGVHPSLAYRLCYSVEAPERPNNDDGSLDMFRTANQILNFKIKRFSCGDGHWAYDVGVDVKRLINGDPDPRAVSKLSWKAHPASCTPCNVIWGAIGRKAEEGLVGKTIQEISDILGLKIAAPLEDNNGSPLHYIEEVDKAAEEPIFAQEFAVDLGEDDVDVYDDDDPERFEDEEEEI